MYFFKDLPIRDQQPAICQTPIDLECAKKQRDTLKIQEICDGHCPLECNSMVYTTSVSSAKYPTNYYWNIIKFQNNFITMSTSKNNFTTDSQPLQMTQLSIPRPFQFGTKKDPQAQPKSNLQLQPRTDLNPHSYTDLNPQPNTYSNPQPNSYQTLQLNTDPILQLNTDPIIQPSTDPTLQPSTDPIIQPSTDPALQPNTNSIPPPNTPQPPPQNVDDRMKDAILMLSFYFDELRYSSIEEQPATDFITLLGVIG